MYWKLNIFIKITVSQQKNLVRRVTLFHIFANLFNIWIHRRKLDSHMYIYVQFPGMCFFSWYFINIRKSSLIKISSWNRSSILMAFSDHCRYPLILYRNWTNNGFLMLQRGIWIHINEPLVPCYIKKCWLILHYAWVFTHVWLLYLYDCLENSNLLNLKIFKR